MDEQVNFDSYLFTSSALCKSDSFKLYNNLETQYEFATSYSEIASVLLMTAVSASVDSPKASRKTDHCNIILVNN